MTTDPSSDFTSPIAGRIEVRVPCPYCGDRQMIPRSQFDEHVMRLHPDVKTTAATSAATDPFEVLRDAETYLSALHNSVARHDNLGADFTCHGCQLREQITAALAAASSAPAVDRRDVQTVLAETVAAYAAGRLGVSVADVLDAAADASAAKHAPTRPAGWAQGREWKADLLHQQARELRAGDETQQAGEGR
jgi:hypothetical protein